MWHRRGRRGYLPSNAAKTFAGIRRPNRLDAATNHSFVAGVTKMLQIRTYET